MIKSNKILPIPSIFSLTIMALLVLGNFPVNLNAQVPLAPSCPIEAKSGRIIVDISANLPSNMGYILSSSGIPQATKGPYAASIPAGVYDVTLASWDGHSGHPGQYQPNEQWYLIIEDSSGDLILNTNTISDLPDDEDGPIIEKVNTNLVLTENAAYLTGFHAAYKTPGNANSIFPLCAAFDRNYTLSTAINSGSGTITAPSINCPGDCEEIYPTETWVTIIATPEEDYAFGSWSSGSGFACEGQTSICSVLMDGNKTARANFDLAIPFDYSLSNSGTSEVTKTDGDAFTQNTITKTLVAGLTEPVTLSLSGVPIGTSYTISNSSCSPTCTSIITFTVTPSTSADTYPITVTGSPLNKETNFDLVVSGNPTIVSCSVSPTIALLGDTVTWTTNVDGGTPPFTYSWSGSDISTSPAPATNPLYMNYTTVGDKTAIVTVTDTDSIQADCPTVTVKVKIDANYKEF